MNKAYNLVGSSLGEAKRVGKRRTGTESFASLFTPRGLFLERSGKLTGPVSYFEIEVSRKLGCVLTSDEVHSASLAENFTV